MALILIIITGGVGYSGIHFADKNLDSLVFVGLGIVIFLSFLGRLYSRFNKQTFLLNKISRLDEILPELCKSFNSESLMSYNGKTMRTQDAYDFIKTHNHLMPEDISPRSMLSLGQAILISLGLFGTFYGLSKGLLVAIPLIKNPVTMQDGLNALFDGAQTAFSKSLVGIGLGTIYLILWRMNLQRCNKIVKKIVIYLNNLGDYQSTQDRLDAKFDELISKQINTDHFRKTSISLSEAAHEMAKAVKPLESAFTKLENFNAQTISKEVSAGVGKAVEDHLRPVLHDINAELHQIHELKLETNKEVTDKLHELIDNLKVSVLDPLSNQLKDTLSSTDTLTANVSKVASNVNALGKTTYQFSASIKQDITKLTESLDVFQKTTIKELNQFSNDLATNFREIGTSIESSVKHAESGMDKQRIAFESSAESAKTVFEEINKTLTQTGSKMNNTLEQTGVKLTTHIEKMNKDAEASFTQLTDGITGSIQIAEASMKQQREAFETSTDNVKSSFQQVQESMQAVFSEQKNTLEQTGKDMVSHIENMNKTAEDSFTRLTDGIASSIQMAESNMQTQKEAFSSSIQQATEGFKAQLEQLEKTGEITTQSIEQAGHAASESLLAVKDAFAESLSKQKESLEVILKSLESAFDQDLEKRKEFGELTESAILRIEKLVEVTNISDIAHQEVLSEIAHDQVEGLNRLSKSMHEHAGIMNINFEQLQTHYDEMRQKEAEWLVNGIEKLGDILVAQQGMLAKIADLTELINIKNNN